MALADRIEDFLGAFGDFFLFAGLDAMRLQELGRAGGRFDVEAQIVEPADQRNRPVLVLIGQRDQHRAVVDDAHVGGLQRLVQRAVEGIVVADRLAGRFHFRG